MNMFLLSSSFVCYCFFFFFFFKYLFSYSSDASHHGPYYRWTNNESLSLVTSWPPPPDNAYVNEDIHLTRQCWLCNHASTQTNEPFTFLHILSLGQGPEWSFRKSVVTSDQLEEQWTPNYDNLCNIRLIIKEVDTGAHTYGYAKLWKIHILYCSITFYSFEMDRISFKMKFKIIVLQPNFQVSLVKYF